MISPTFPDWLQATSIVSLTIALLCAVFIAADEIARPQKMWIMNLVWPLTALFGGLLWLALYLSWGRGARQGREEKSRETPFAVAVAKASSHCGAGCALGDLTAEWAAFAIPALAVAFGWKSLFSDKIFAVWALDFMIAYGLGVVFQYYTIKPMRDLRPGEAILQALKADTASITSWQVGMYGFMAFAQFAWFRPAYGRVAPVDTPEFWFAMQLAMLCGFATSYPVNWALLRLGIKEKM